MGCALRLPSRGRGSATSALEPVVARIISTVRRVTRSFEPEVHPQTFTDSGVILTRRGGATCSAEWPRHPSAKLDLGLRVNYAGRL